MNSIKSVSIGFLLIAITSFTTDNVPKEFTDLLDRAKLNFQNTVGLEETKIIVNRQMNYEYALKYPKKKFEVRYAIRPLDDLIKDYNQREKDKKPGDVNIHHNKLYASMFQATILNISGGKLPQIAAFDKQAVKAEFNADWGATTMVEVGKEFGQEYKYCMIVAIHKDNIADAYFFYLSDTKDGFDELMLPAFHSMRFK
jgi:hypothetical protein